MMLSANVRSTLYSLIFVLISVAILTQRFLISLICALAAVFIVCTTLFIYYSIRRTFSNIVGLFIRSIIAIFLTSSVLFLMSVISMSVAERLEVFLPLFVLHLMCLPPLSYGVDADKDYPSIVKSVSIYALIFGVAITMLGLLQELLLFQEVSFMIDHDTSEVGDNPFRLLIFAQGGMLLLGYLHSFLRPRTVGSDE